MAVFSNCVSPVGLVKMSFNLLMHCRWEANFSDTVERAGLGTWCRMTSTLAGAIYRQPFPILSSPPAHRAMQSTGRREGSLYCTWVVRKEHRRKRGLISDSFPFLGVLGRLGMWSRHCGLMMCMIDVFTVSLRL